MIYCGVSVSTVVYAKGVLCLGALAECAFVASLRFRPWIRRPFDERKGCVPLQSYTRNGQDGEFKSAGGERRAASAGHRPNVDFHYLSIFDLSSAKSSQKLRSAKLSNGQLSIRGFDGALTTHLLLSRPPSPRPAPSRPRSELLGVRRARESYKIKCQMMCVSLTRKQKSKSEINKEYTRYIRYAAAETQRWKQQISDSMRNKTQTNKKEKKKWKSFARLRLFEWTIVCSVCVRVCVLLTLFKLFYLYACYIVY